MDLTNYLPPDLIDLAHEAVEEPSILSRPGLATNERLALFSVAMMLEGGAKLIRPSAATCKVLTGVELNIAAGEYAQPYGGLGVILPGPLFGATRGRIATSAWVPGRPAVVVLFGERETAQAGATKMDILTIDPPPGLTIEEFLSGLPLEEGMNAREAARLHEIIPVARVVINLCLFAVERGVRELPLDARAEKRRRKARTDGRMARLAARDAQEVVIQDLDLILRASAAAEGEGDGPTGWRQRMHRRRGHWKMQACGPGHSLRKRIFVQSYMVNADDDPDGEVQSILS